MREKKKKRHRLAPVPRETPLTSGDIHRDLEAETQVFELRLAPFHGMTPLG
jgi:hypothetical protein